MDVFQRAQYYKKSKTKRYRAFFVGGIPLPKTDWEIDLPLTA
jgi:hypothetical protein